MASPNLSPRPQDARGQFHVSHALTLIALLILPAWATWQLASAEHIAWIAAWVVLASVITYTLYAWDKRSARRGENRIPENVLHFWELIGGWPGAFLAQRSLRHKCIKVSYQCVFWLIVASHQYIALDWPLDWRFFREGKALVHATLSPTK